MLPATYQGQKKKRYINAWIQAQYRKRRNLTTGEIWGQVELCNTSSAVQTDDKSHEKSSTVILTQS